MAYKRRWLRPGKVLDYYVLEAPGVRTYKDASYQLYWAVIEGNVRARHKGNDLKLDDLDRLRAKKWSDDPDDSYALPFDIELSVEDVERIWNDDDIDPADRVAVHGMSEGQLILSTETALLNLSTLLNRLQVRRRGSEDSAAQFKAEFEQRWKRHFHEATTYIPHVKDLSDAKH
jgi:hypothetical protein